MAPGVTEAPGVPAERALAESTLETAEVPPAMAEMELQVLLAEKAVTEAPEEPRPFIR